MGEVKIEQPTKGIARLVLSSTIALAFVSVGFMLPGVIRTKFATLIFGIHGVAFIGQLSQIQTVLISLGAAGVVTATRVILARKNISGAELRGVQNWLLLLPTLVAVLFAIIVAAFSVPLSALLLGSENYAGMLAAAAAGIPAAVYGQITLAIAQVRASRSRLLAAAALSAISGGGVVIALVVSRDELWASTSFIAAPLLQAVVITVMCPEARFSARVRPRLPREHVSEVFALAWSSAALGIFAATAELVGRIVVVQRYGLESLAPYQPVVLIVTQVVGMLLSALATSSLIEVAQLPNREDLARKLDELTASLIPMIGGVLAILSGLAHVMIVVLFSVDLVPAALSLVSLGLAGEVTRAYAWILGSCLLPQKLRSLWLLNGLITVAVQLAVSCLAGYFFGPLGLVLALLSGNLFSAVFTLIVVTKAGIPVRKRGLLLVVIIAIVLVHVPMLGVGLINFMSIGLGLVLLTLAKYLPKLRRRIVS